MGIIQTIESASHSQHLGEFFKLARSLTLNRGDLLSAANYAKGTRATQRVVDILHRAATSPGTLSTWADIAEYQTLAQAFSNSLRQFSVFDAVLPYMTPAPLRSRGLTVTTGITAGKSPEGKVKIISSLALGEALVDPRKSVGIVVVNKEVLDHTHQAAAALFNRELQLAVAAATDADFIAALIAATTPIASTSTPPVSATAMLDDITALATAVTSNANSQLFYIVSAATAKKVGLKLLTGGASLNDVPNLTMVATDQIADDKAVMVDATGIAGSADSVTLDASEQASLQLDSAPIDPPTAAAIPTNLWQSNRRALRAERYYAFTILRASAVASMTGISY